MLTSWWNNQEDEKEAYKIMGDSLIHKNVGLRRIARKVLDYPPRGTDVR